MSLFSAEKANWTEHMSSRASQALAYAMEHDLRTQRLDDLPRRRATRAGSHESERRLDSGIQAPEAVRSLPASGGQKPRCAAA